MNAKWPSAPRTGSCSFAIWPGDGRRGIAVLCYDKRTKTYGQRVSGLNFTIWDETVDDAVAAVALVRKLPEVDRGNVFVLGTAWAVRDRWKK